MIDDEHEHHLVYEDVECTACGGLTECYEYCRECGYFDMVYECDCYYDEDEDDDIDQLFSMWY